MKKSWIFVAVVLLFAGCSAQGELETVTDVYGEQPLSPAKQIVLELPQEVAVPAMQSKEAGTLYLCEDYTVTVQTGEAGDLNATLREATGFEKEQLALVETVRGELACYECAWSSAGEAEQQVGRAVVLDDGNYHYVVTVMADASQAGALQKTWQALFDSMYLTDTAP